VYREQTEPLSGFYEAEGLLTRIDAIGAVEEVTERAMRALGKADGDWQPDGPTGQPSAG
jgi:adenylate kinase